MRPAFILLILSCAWITCVNAAITDATDADAYLDGYGPITFERTPDPTLEVPVATNADQTLLHPNQDQPSVQQMHNQSVSASPIDNRTRALANPNQNQISNQEIIRSRLERIFPEGQ